MPLPSAQPAVLINGKVNSRVVEHLTPHFQLLYLPKPAMGEVTDEMAANVAGIANFGSVPAALMDLFPKLQIIANFGVGYDGIDVSHAAGRRIVVTNTPDVLNGEVADTTIGLLINTIRLLPKAESWLRGGRWVRDGAFILSPLSLQGRRVGIYGMGRIGIEIAKRLEGFGVALSYHTRNPRKEVSYPYYPSLEALARGVDTLICIVPKTPGTHKTVNRAILQALGANGVLINVGRGWTVDEDDLALALKDGTIAAAGLDVFYDEPNVPDALLALGNACLLPHVASASVPTRNAMADLVSDNLIGWFTKGAVLTPVMETPVIAKSVI